MNYSKLNQFKTDLKRELGMPLPGNAAHQKLMVHRKPVERLGAVSETAKKSAVLLLVYPKNYLLHIVFIQRPIYDGVHSGQIAFPGGKLETFDESISAAAIREANEEIAVNPNAIELMGRLTPIYIPPSNYLVHPFVAFHEDLPSFVPQPSEVKAIIECPIANFMGVESLKTCHLNLGEKKMEVTAFQFEQHIIWGATGMILREFVDLLERITVPSELK